MMRQFPPCETAKIVYCKEAELCTIVKFRNFVPVPMEKVVARVLLGII